MNVRHVRRGFARRCAVAATAALTIASLSLTSPANASTPQPGDVGVQANPQGIDVSSANGAVNWTSVRNAGIEFAYIKATEGTSVKDSRFNTNYPAAYHAGVIRGAAHFALPNLSTGAAQADYFASSGGAWSADNLTLPGAVDLEGNPYGGGYCYGLTQAGMRTWLHSFMDRYFARTARYAVVYTTLSWWTTCTGNYTGLARNHPLWIARWATTPGTLPGGWGFYTFWQYSDCRTVPGISGCVTPSVFNGTRTRLIALANNTP